MSDLLPLAPLVNDPGRRKMCYSIRLIRASLMVNCRVTSIVPAHRLHAV
jgi:hypothetical protein